MATTIHIGDTIKAELKRQERSIAWLARKIKMDPGNLSRLLQQPMLQFNVLYRISAAMNHNFVREIADDVDKRLKKRM